jgi:hypothetical protein
MVNLESLKSQVNLPVVGSVSLAAAIVAGAAIFFLTRRKKSINLKF